MLFFFFKQKTAYEMRISDWSSDVCSSDLVKKGCYPGQEIVARTHFLGQAKRGLALFECDAPLEAGQQVMDGDRTTGAIASTATSGGQHVALAVLPLDAATGAAAVEGHPLRERKSVAEGKSVSARLDLGVTGLSQNK